VKKITIKTNKYKGNGFHIQVPLMLHGTLVGVQSIWAMLESQHSILKALTKI
jgi:hypothetical protein